MSTQKYALVTGCSEGGMGWSVAREFARRGIHTFATLRTVSKAGSLAKEANVTVLEMDVTSEESVAACVAAVSAQTGGRLDVLYNNAGAQNVMPLADQDLAAARRFWETNVWSVLLVTQRFLPLLVAAGGYVANPGSVRADLPAEFDGLYGASKAAVHLMTDNMRFEFAPLGVRVATVHIGAVATHIFNQAGDAKAITLPEASYYKPIESQIDAIARGATLEGRTLMDPDTFARKIVGDILAGKDGHLWRGAYASLTKYLRHLLPRWIIEALTLNNEASGINALAKERAQKRA